VAAHLMGLQVRIPWGVHGCLSLVECCVLPGIGLCNGPITCPESPTDCGVSLCDI
jgi:hypothetical protein